MALLASNTFYEVSFTSTNPSWAAFPAPALPAAVVDAIVTGASFLIYVIDSPTGTIVFEGGMATGLDDVMIATSSSLPDLTTSASGGQSWINVIDSAGGWAFYDTAAGTLRKVSGIDQAALKAFL